MNLSRLAKTLLMATACSAAIAACGDDDGGVGGGAGGGVGGGAGGGVGGGTGGGGGAATTVTINIRFAQLIPDAQTSGDADAGAVNPGVRICVKAGGASYGQPLPTQAQSPIGIPAGGIGSYSNIPFPNVTSDVYVYLAAPFDAETAGSAEPCLAAETDPQLTAARVLMSSIDPASIPLTTDGYYTAVLTGLFNPAATLVAFGARACDGTCPAPALSVIQDDLTGTASSTTVRVVNGIANGGDLDVCFLPLGPAEPLLQEGTNIADPIPVGGSSTYYVRDAIAGPGTLFASQRPAGADGGLGDPCPLPPGGLSLWAANSTVPTPVQITAQFDGTMGAAEATSTFDNNEVVTVFLYGLADDFPPDGPGLGSAIIPILDQPTPAP